MSTGSAGSASSPALHFSSDGEPTIVFRFKPPAPGFNATALEFFSGFEVQIPVGDIYDYAADVLDSRIVIGRLFTDSMVDSLKNYQGILPAAFAEDAFVDYFVGCPFDEISFSSSLESRYVGYDWLTSLCRALMDHYDTTGSTRLHPVYVRVDPGSLALMTLRGLPWLAAMPSTAVPPTTPALDFSSDTSVAPPGSPIGSSIRQPTVESGHHGSINTI